MLKRTTEEILSWFSFGNKMPYQTAILCKLFCLLYTSNKYTTLLVMDDLNCFSHALSLHGSMELWNCAIIGIQGKLVKTKRSYGGGAQWANFGLQAIELNQHQHLIYFHMRVDVLQCQFGCNHHDWTPKWQHFCVDLFSEKRQALVGGNVRTLKWGWRDHNERAVNTIW